MTLNFEAQFAITGSLDDEIGLAVGAVAQNALKAAGFDPPPLPDRFEVPAKSQFAVRFELLAFFAWSMEFTRRHGNRVSGAGETGKDRSRGRRPTSAGKRNRQRSENREDRSFWARS